VDLLNLGYWVATLFLIAAIALQFKQLRYAQQIDQEWISISATTPNGTQS
jgi:hypothetical protein